LLVTGSPKHFIGNLTRVAVAEGAGAVRRHMVLFLQYYLHAGGDRVHELQKFDPTGQQTCSAHPTPFFAEDKDSGHCSTVKKPCRVFMTTCSEAPLPSDFMSAPHPQVRRNTTSAPRGPHHHLPPPLQHPLSGRKFDCFFLFGVFFFFFECVFAVLEFELRAYTLSHSTNPFL
jgi:H/ACA ribonucleoprotein complex subunit 3